MKIGFRIHSALTAMLAAAQVSAASPEIAGVWRGKLQVDPKTEMTIQFTFAKKPDGTYSAVLDSPDNAGIKNVSANAVSLSDSALQVQVNALSGSYKGTVKSGAIEGQWQQPGGSLPLTLSPYQKAQLSKADIDTIVGAWNGPLMFPVGTLTMVMRFKATETGELQGTLSVPEQGGNELPMSEVEFAGGKLTLKVPQVHGEFTAAYANGQLAGAWKQGGNPPDGTPVTLERGDAGARSYTLNLSGPAFAAISGDWKGTLKTRGPQGQEVSLPVVLRFLTDQRANMIGFLDSPSQGAKDIPITEASLTGAKFVAKIAPLGAEFRADLDGKTLTGEWTQGPVGIPLKMTKE